MNYYLEPLRRYFDFSGRSRRTEYWTFFLVNLVLGFVLGALFAPGAIVFALVMFIPHIAVTVRRFHDIGWSGWWTLLAFIPFIGLVVLIFMLMDSKPGPNPYGPNPKEPPTLPSAAPAPQRTATD